MGRVTGSVLVLVVCGLLEGGCGSSSSSKNDAVSKCKDAAKSISDSNARKAAEDACSAAGNAAKSVSTAAEQGVSTAVTSAVNSAKKQCLAAAKQLPAGPARTAAETACQ